MLLLLLHLNLRVTSLFLVVLRAGKLTHLQRLALKLLAGVAQRLLVGLVVVVTVGLRGLLEVIIVLISAALMMVDSSWSVDVIRCLLLDVDLLELLHDDLR